MIIKDLKNNELTVYGIYWVGGENYFLTSPKLHQGLIAYPEKDIQIIDNHLDRNMIFTKTSGGTQAILHSVLVKDNFLDLILEDGQGNYKEFTARLGHEP